MPLSAPHVIECTSMGTFPTTKKTKWIWRYVVFGPITCFFFFFFCFVILPSTPWASAPFFDPCGKFIFSAPPTPPVLPVWKNHLECCSVSTQVKKNYFCSSALVSSTHVKIPFGCRVLVAM
jgi:hypothetical protein